MNRLLAILLINLAGFSTISAMQHESPTSTPKSPKEIATCVANKLFDRPDDQVIVIFAQILTRDLKGNVELQELRYKMIRQLQQGEVCTQVGLR